MQSELQLQAQCFQWLWNTYPETRLLCWHVTNEMKPMRFSGGFGKDIQEEPAASFYRRIAQAKAAGLVPGVWDLHFLWRGKLHLFEFKIGVNKLTAEQLSFGDKAQQHGACIYDPCYSLAEFQVLIRRILCVDAHFVI